MTLKAFVPETGALRYRSLVTVEVENRGKARQTSKPVFKRIGLDVVEPDGAIVETVYAGCEVRYHVMRGDRRIDLTPKMAARRLADAFLGRGAPTTSILPKLGSDAVLSRRIRGLAPTVLRNGANGTRITLAFAAGGLDASSEKEKVGEYRGAYKGWAQFGQVHHLVCDPDAVRRAELLLGSLIIGDILVLEAKPLDSEPGILELRGARNGRAGAEIGTVYVAEDPSDPTDVVVAKTVRGVRTIHGQMLRYAEEKAAKDAAAAELQTAYARDQERRRKEAEQLREIAEAAGEADAAAYVDLVL